MDRVSIKSNNHNCSLVNSVDHFKAVDSFVDVTLVCEGHTVKAHKVILAAGSNVLRRLLLANPAKHPILILAETKYDTLRLVIDFLYKGKVDIPRDGLHKVLQFATTFEINDLKNLCKESLNSEKGDSVSNSQPCSKSSELSGSSSKRQRRESCDSEILFEGIVPKEEIISSPCRLEQPEFSPLPDSLYEATLVEFQPQIANTRSMLMTSGESSTGSNAIGSSVQKVQKDVATECATQPQKERMSNPGRISTKLARSMTKPSYAEVAEDSESDTQNNMKCTMKRKRSKVWAYFVPVQNYYAVCKLCHRKLSYRTTVTNLTKHLQKRHSRFDPRRPPKLPDVPLLRLQNDQLEIFEEIDYDDIEAEADAQDDEQYEEDEDSPSTSSPCIMKIA